MNDFLGKPLAVGDNVVWRGHLSGDCRLRKGVVQKFTATRVWIKTDHWWQQNKEVLRSVHPNLLVKVDA